MTYTVLPNQFADPSTPPIGRPLYTNEQTSIPYLQTPPYPILQTPLLDSTILQTPLH